MNRVRRWGKALHSPNSHRLGTLVLFVGTLISRMLGFVREVAMATIFGTTVSTDTWLMASILPNLLFGTIYSALSNVIVPVMSGRGIESVNDQETFAGEMLAACTAVALILTAGGEAFAPWAVRMLAPGFDLVKLSSTLLMTRIMIPTVVFWILSGLLMGILQSKDIYAPTSSAPVVMNIVRISTIVVLGRLFGIAGVALGFTLAVLTQLVYLMSVFGASGLRLRYRWSLSHPWTRQALRLSLPFFYASAAGTTGVVVDRILASYLPAGSIAALNYALVLSQLPNAIIVNAYVIPYFTRISAEWNVNRTTNFTHSLLPGLEIITILLFPITAVLIAEPDPLLHLLYQHGVFNALSTDVTARVLVCWAIGVPAAGWNLLLSRVLFARREAAVSVRLATTTIAFNIAMDLLLIHPLGASGLALGTSLAGWLRTILLLNFLGGTVAKWPAIAWIRISQHGLAATFMGLVVWLFVSRSHLTLSHDPWIMGLNIVAVATLGLGSYVAALRAGTMRTRPQSNGRA